MLMNAKHTVQTSKQNSGRLDLFVAVLALSGLIAGWVIDLKGRNSPTEPNQVLTALARQPLHETGREFHSISHHYRVD